MLSIYKTILKNGIKQTHTDKTTGGIFVIRNKEDFETMHGRIVTSFQQLNTVTGSHWTPNVYRTFFYTPDNKIAGFEERQLRQINVFMVDIDTKEHSLNEILLTCVDDSIGAPSFVLQTARGYQVGFNLSTPFYVTKKSLKIAKRISHNIKRSLACVDADLFCNDFGFFRMPTNDNLIWNQIDTVYSPEELIQWSQTFDNGQPLYSSKQATNTLYTQSEWFQVLTSAKNVHGTKGQLGRNNLLFTIALACFADGLKEDAAETLVLNVNTNFQQPLKKGEVCTILASAYSGKYNGPAVEYVEAFLSMFGVQMNVSLNRGWYKHKKDRSERVRSHLKEWEQDIVRYLEACPAAVEMSQTALCKAIGVPRASLNKLILQSRQIIKKVVGVGRNAKTTWTTLAQFAQNIIDTIKAKKIQFNEMLRLINDTLLAVLGYDVVERLIQLNAINIFDDKKLSTVP